MLVLARKRGERICVEHLGAVLEIQVLTIGPDQVKLGFSGPRGIQIWRDNAKRKASHERTPPTTPNLA